MKNLKLFESWSEEYLFDFTDHGFDVKETDRTVTGKFKGNFIVTDINNWYASMIDRLDDDFGVFNSKISFNKTTGSVSFDVEVKPKTESIELQVNNQLVEVYPTSVVYTYWENWRKWMTIGCKTREGRNTSLNINLSDSDVGLSLGNKTRIQIEKDQWIKLFDILKDFEMENYQREILNKFSSHIIRGIS